MLLHDFRFAARLLAARPGWTIAAVLCLAIATGANTAAFTLVNGLLLRPLPFDDPGRLVMVALRDPVQHGPRPFALREYRELAAASAPTIQLFARTFFPLSLAAGDGARMTQAELVSGSYFETLRVRPFAGRLLTVGDDRAGAVPVLVLSYQLWRTRFAGRLDIVGREVRVNGRSATIIGIAAPGFSGAMQLVAADAWLPAALYRVLAGSASVDDVPTFGVMGRLAAGVTHAGAEAQLSSAAERLPPHPGRPGAAAAIVTPAAGFGVPVAIQGTVLTLSTFIYVMMALLMGVACANVAALVLARGAGRTREVATRLSLGASRWRITRQLLVESALLAVAGCAAGSVLAVWMTQALVARLTTPFQYISYAVNVHPDGRVFAYVALATVTTAALCGIAPVRMARRVDVIEALKQSPTVGTGRTSMRTLNSIVALQFTISTALLIVAGMLARTYIGGLAPHPSVDTSRIVLSTLDVAQIGLDETAGIRVYSAVVDRAAKLSGVLDIGLTADPPFAPAASVKLLVEAETGQSSPAAPIAAHAVFVSSRYFSTMGLALRDGRGFSDPESRDGRTAIVDETLARRLWPRERAAGHRIRIDTADSEPFDVIGVVANLDLSSRGLSEGTFYRPFDSSYTPRMTMVIRTTVDGRQILPEVRKAVRDVNPDLAIVDLRTLDEFLQVRQDSRRIPVAALSVIGVLGLLLSAVGQVSWRTAFANARGSSGSVLPWAPVPRTSHGWCSDRDSPLLRSASHWAPARRSLPRVCSTGTYSASVPSTRLSCRPSVGF
jgi:putative ABC transport system permease protein